MDDKYIVTKAESGIIRRVWYWDVNGVEYLYEASWRPHPSDHRALKQMRISYRNAQLMRRKASNQLPTYDAIAMGYYYSD